MSLMACGNNYNKNDDGEIDSLTISENVTKETATKKEEHKEATTENKEMIENSETIEIKEIIHNYVLNGPSDLELMSYAQTGLEDFYLNCEYSRNTRDYTFTNTDLKYEIEGEVSVSKNASKEKFFMIIKFVDENYEQYDLICYNLEMRYYMRLIV